MIYADLTKLDIPEALREELDKAACELKSMKSVDERKSLINSTTARRLWGKTRGCLIVLTGENSDDAKCWYCESKGPGFTHHIDHFRPKGRVLNRNKPPEPGYWWLTFDPMNYRLSCQRCNTGSGKLDQFPLAEGCKRAICPDDKIEDEVVLLLDPAHSSDRLLLAFSEDGRVYPRHIGSSLLASKASLSIEVYHLNHIEKVEARKQAWLMCERLAQRALRALEQAENASLGAQQCAVERFEDICQDIAARASSSAEFSAMARYCFRGTGRDWLLELIP